MTTEWVILAMVPVLPLKSVRVIENGSETVVFGFKDKYVLVHETDLNWKQVACVWSFTLALLVWIVGGFAATIYFDLGRKATLFLFVFGLTPFALPLLLRHRKRQIAMHHGRGLRNVFAHFSVHRWWTNTNRHQKFAVIAAAIFAGLVVFAIQKR